MEQDQLNTAVDDDSDPLDHQNDNEHNDDSDEGDTYVYAAPASKDKDPPQHNLLINPDNATKAVQLKKPRSAAAAIMGVKLWHDFVGNSQEKYFWTYPFWKQGIRLRQSEDQGKLYMDEAAVRARAGVINIIAWCIMINNVTNPTSTLIFKVGPIMFFDMIAGSAFGLTPFCPTGVLGTIIAWRIEPLYSPSAPKRLAWLLGACMIVFCVVIKATMGRHWVLKIVICSCILLTWMESSLGFCLGCYIYAKMKGFRRYEPKHRISEFKPPVAVEYSVDDLEMATCSIDDKANLCGS